MYSVCEDTDFVIKSTPGTTAYGQPGERGVKGNIGNGFYYCDSSFSGNTLPSDIADKVIQNKSLFGNNDLTINYAVNDYLLCCNGDVYRIAKITSIAVNVEYIENIFTESSDKHFRIKVENVTSTDSMNETLSYVQQNPYYKHPYSPTDSSPRIYHRDRYSKNICGFWFKYTVIMDDNDADMSNCIYKYAMELKNGKRISKISHSMVDYLFIDTRYILDSAYNNSTVNGDLDKLYNVISYNGIDNNNENTNSTYPIYKSLYSNIISSVYCEIINTKTSKVVSIVDTSTANIL